MVLCRICEPLQAENPASIRFFFVYFVFILEIVTARYMCRSGAYGMVRRMERYTDRKKDSLQNEVEDEAGRDFRN